MINKILPRILNSSKDSRVRANNEMKDAINVRVTDGYDADFSAGGVGDNDGDAGVIKPAPGNLGAIISNTFALDNIFDPSAEYNRRVIGKIEDTKVGVVYFFVFSNELNEMGVYAWDASNYFGSGLEAWRPIYCTPEFNFSSTSRVVGDIVHVSGGAEEDFRPILYFTDDENEPRKIDVLRCLEFGHTPALLNNYSPNDIHDKDFITACPRSPIVPPTFEFFQEAGTRASDFRKVPGVQFAYQCVYRSGEVSALSTYSDIAIPEQYLRQGVITGETNLPQLCRISIDPAPFDALTISEEVVSFKILVRRGNDGPFYIVDEIDKDGSFATVTTYNFYNDKVLLGITESEEKKQYDNLPRRAQAISVIENRLFYGNYVEGYDEAPFDAVVTANYLPAPTSSVSFELVATPITMTPSDAATVSGAYGQRVTGIAIDTSVIDEVLPIGTTISVSFSFQPDGNIALYNSEGGYHNSKIIGGVNNNTGYVAQGFAEVFDLTSDIQWLDSLDPATLAPASDLAISSGSYLTAMGSGPGVAPPLQWVQTEGILEGSTSVTEARIGVSAAAPLKLKGGVVNFSIELETLEVISDAPNVVASVIGAALSGQDIPDSFSLNQSNINPSYNFNHGLRSVEPDDALEAGYVVNLHRLGVAGVPFDPELAINVPTDSQKDALDCITAVFEEFDISGNGIDPTPIGYCIVNEANVGMSMVHHSNMTSDPLGNCILSLEVDVLSNVDVLTCVPILTAPDYKVRQWRLFSGEYLSVYQILDVDFGANFGSDFSFSGTPASFLNGAFHTLGTGVANFFDAGLDNRGKMVGYLRPSGSESLSVEGSDIYITNNQIRSELTIPDVIPVGLEQNYLNRFGTSIVDSEGCFSYERPIITIERASGAGAGFQKGISRWNGNMESEGPISSLMILSGMVIWRPAAGSQIDIPNLPFNDLSPEDFASASLWAKSLLGSAIGLYTESPVQEVNLNPQEEGEASKLIFVDPVSPLFLSQNQLMGDAVFVATPETGEQLQEIEAIYDVFGEQLEVSGQYRSFKTSAYHDLGIVYYDDRGRPGNVNVLPRVYVAGYSNEERNQDKGRVQLEITLNSDPPEWAHQYQIVYAGNSTYQDFIQYTVGGAFIDERGDTVSGRNIYVSLNHLQQDSQISYAESFGAVDTNGTKDLYTFVPGDQVRVISYEESPAVTVYPNQLVFDVVDQLILTGNNDATTEETRNPLDSGSADTPLFLQGSFIQLRDRPESVGFNWSSVRLQGNDFGGPQSNWGKRCVVEIVRPRASADSDIRGYQETGLVFNVGRSNTGGAQATPEGVYHQTPTIFMDNGDVWWRRIPVNFQAHDGSEFVSLIPESIEEENGDALQVSYQPRFRNRYLESKTFTDTFPGADVNGYGKIKFYSPEAAEVRRESSITYSDTNDFSTRRVKFTSFNPYQAPFKDLPNQYGAINAFVEMAEFLLVVQQDKTSALPINRNILSDASGGSQLISSDKIVGSQKFISGSYGADNNRESVIRVDDTVYFANKSKGEVYRYRSGKVEVISRKGMQSFLYDAFRDNIAIDNIRVVSGYDPLADEYILSVINITSINATSPSLFTQPYLNPFVFGGSVTDTGGTGTTPDGPSDWETNYEDPMEDLVVEVVNGGGTAPDGVAPTGTAPPNEYTTDVAEYNKDEIISVIQGNPPVDFDPISDPKDLNNQIAEFGATPPFSLNLDAYLPTKVRNAIGDFTYYDGASSVGSYSYLANRISNIPSVAAADSIAASLSSVQLVVTSGGYRSYLNEFSGLLDTPQMNLRGALDIRAFELTDLVTSTVLNIKNTYEQQVINLADSIPALLQNIQEDVDTAGLSNNLTVSTLISEANLAYQELDNYITNTLGRETQAVSFLSDDLPDETANGFGNLKFNQYPLNDLEIFTISSINTLMDNIGDSVNPLLSLDGIDVTDILESNAREISGLRSQLDVLTNQVQNLSSAPVATTGEAFIPDVTANQITSDALESFAGIDQEITIDDVVRTPELSAQIEQIIELYGNTTAAPPTAETLQPIIAEVIRQLSTASGYGQGPTAQFAAFNQASDQAVLSNLGNQLNPLDLSSDSIEGVKDGLFGVTDIISTLGNFSSFFGQQGDQTGSVGQLEGLYNMWQSSDPFAQYEQDVQNGLAGAGSLNVDFNELLYGILWYKNKENGTSQTATSYSELGVTHFDLDIPPEIESLLTITLFWNFAGQNTAVFDGFLSQLGVFPQIINPDETNPQSAAYPWLFGSTKLDGGYLGLFGVPLFSNFGQQTTQSLDNATVLDIITNALENAQ